MPADRKIQFRVTEEEEAELLRRSAEAGLSVSETIRRELALDKPKPTSLQMFELAQERAAEQIKAAGLPSLTDEEITAFCAAVRKERAREATRLYA